MRKMLPQSHRHAAAKGHSTSKSIRGGRALSYVVFAAVGIIVVAVLLLVFRSRLLPLDGGPPQPSAAVGVKGVAATSTVALQSISFGSRRSSAHLNRSRSALVPHSILRAVSILRNVLIFGDSLTAGAYYDEERGSLKLRAVNWGPQVQLALHEKLCAGVQSLADEEHSNAIRGVRHYCQRCMIVPDKKAADALRVPKAECDSVMRVTTKGFPGKDTVAIASKLKKWITHRRQQQQHHHANLRSPHYSLVVTMTGTNDVLGVRQHTPASTSSAIQALHAWLHAHHCQARNREVCRDRQHEEEPANMTAVMYEDCCATAVLLTPPLNYSIPPLAYGQRIPRAYCQSKVGIGDLLVQRRLLLHADLKRNTSSVRTCLFDWDADAQMPHDMHSADPREVWSDCLHPNRVGYFRFGDIVADHLWHVATETTGDGLCRA